MQAEHHNFSLEKASLNDKIEELEDRIEELQETAENARWELKKARLREDRSLILNALNLLHLF